MLHVCLLTPYISVQIALVLFSVLPNGTSADAEPPEELQGDGCSVARQGNVPVQRQRACRQAETVEQAHLRLAKDRESHRASRQAETAECTYALCAVVYQPAAPYV